VTVCLEESNLDPMGAQSIHAATFNSTGFTQDLSNFDLVGSDGLPCGPWGPCSLTVLADETLWVQWHLRPSIVGNSTNGISTSCPGNVFVSATATLYDNADDCSGTVLDSCEGDASGWIY
jgi:hypothetical protein